MCDEKPKAKWRYRVAHAQSLQLVGHPIMTAPGIYERTAVLLAVMSDPAQPLAPHLFQRFKARLVHGIPLPATL